MKKNIILLIVFLLFFLSSCSYDYRTSSTLEQTCTVKQGTFDICKSDSKVCIGTVCSDCLSKAACINYYGTGYSCNFVTGKCTAEINETLSFIVNSAPSDTANNLNIGDNVTIKFQGKSCKAGDYTLTFTPAWPENGTFACTASNLWERAITITKSGTWKVNVKDIAKGTSIEKEITTKTCTQTECDATKQVCNATTGVCESCDDAIPAKKCIAPKECKSGSSSSGGVCEAPTCSTACTGGLECTSTGCKCTTSSCTSPKTCSSDGTKCETPSTTCSACPTGEVCRGLVCGNCDSTYPCTGGLVCGTSGKCEPCTTNIDNCGSGKYCATDSSGTDRKCKDNCAPVNSICTGTDAGLVCNANGRCEPCTTNPNNCGSDKYCGTDSKCIVKCTASSCGAQVCGTSGKCEDCTSTPTDTCPTGKVCTTESGKKVCKTDGTTTPATEDLYFTKAFNKSLKGATLETDKITEVGGVYTLNIGTNLGMIFKSTASDFTCNGQTLYKASSKRQKDDNSYIDSNPGLSPAVCQSADPSLLTWSFDSSKSASSTPIIGDKDGKISNTDDNKYVYDVKDLINNGKNWQVNIQKKEVNTYKDLLSKTFKITCTPNTACASTICSNQTCHNGCGNMIPGTKTTGCSDYSITFDPATNLAINAKMKIIFKTPDTSCTDSKYKINYLWTGGNINSNPNHILIHNDPKNDWKWYCNAGQWTSNSFDTIGLAGKWTLTAYDTTNNTQITSANYTIYGLSFNRPLYAKINESLTVLFQTKDTECKSSSNYKIEYIYSHYVDNLQHKIEKTPLDNINWRCTAGLYSVLVANGVTESSHWQLIGYENDVKISDSSYEIYQDHKFSSVAPLSGWCTKNGSNTVYYDGVSVTGNTNYVQGNKVVMPTDWETSFDSCYEICKKN